MTDSTNPHAGIELDVLDFSKATKVTAVESQAGFAKNKTDTRDFIKAIYKKIIENDSFLSFSVQVNDVNRILQTKYSSANDIAKVILKDVALTTKLLKLVNSSFYGNFSKKGIATISEAMIILGTEEIKLAAASLKIYEFMQDIATVKVLKDKALKSLQRSLVALQIARDEGIIEAETIQISAMLYDLGEYLVALFSPEVYINVEVMMEDQNISRDAASKKIIGASYSDIGRLIAKKWQLPQSVVMIMQPVTDYELPKERMNRENMLRYICAFASELCAMDVTMEGKYLGHKIVGLSDKYRKCLNISAPAAVKLLKMSWNNISRHASILGVSNTNTK